MLGDYLARLDRFATAREWDLAQAWWRPSWTRSEENRSGPHYGNLISSRDSRNRTNRDGNRSDKRASDTDNNNNDAKNAEPIRLLLIYPARASSTSTVHAKFVRASLTDPPNYEALSYTWGNPFADPLAVGNDDHDHDDALEFNATGDARLGVNEARKNESESEASLQACRTAQQRRAWSASQRRHMVHVNGHNVEVGQNLHDALLAIREPRRKKLIWVDALCINQADDDEKRHQVSIMNLIYRNASRVFVWLGPGLPYSTFLRANSGQHLDVGETTDEEDNHSRPLDPWNVNRMLLFGRIFTSSWFQRLWIVQEAAVAQDLVFRCGNVVVELWELESLARTWAWVNLPDIGYKSALDEEIVERALRSYNRIAAARTVTDQIRLEVAMRAWRRGLCSDPRDRVYALLSISRRTKSGRLLLEPDYTLSPEELGRRLVIESIKAYKTIDVLRYVIHTAGPIKGFASWATQLQTKSELKSGIGEMTSPVIEPSEHIIADSEAAHRHPKRPLPRYHDHRRAITGDRRHALILNGRAVLRIPTVGKIVYDKQHMLSQECDPNNSYRFQVRTSVSVVDAALFDKYVQELAGLATLSDRDEAERARTSSEAEDFFAGSNPAPGSFGDNSLTDLREMYEQLSLRWDWSVPTYGDFENQAATVFERNISGRFPSEMYLLRRLALASSGNSTHAHLSPRDGQDNVDARQERRGCGLHHAIVPRDTQPGDVVVMLSHSRNPFVLRPLDEDVSTEADPDRLKPPSSPANDRRVNGSAGGKKIRIQTLPNGAQAEANAQDVGQVIENGVTDPTSPAHSTSPTSPTIKIKKDSNNTPRPPSSTSRSSARRRFKAAATAAATLSISSRSQSRSRSVSLSRSRSRSRSRSVSVSRPRSGEHLAQMDEEKPKNRDRRLGGASSPLSLTHEGATTTAAGSKSDGKASPVRRRAKYSFVGACYLDHRLDWEAFEALEMQEVDEMWIY